MEGSPPRRKLRPPSPPGSAAAQPSLDCLPSEILENIVARLGIREAVRTSAVSRAWRRRWEASPGLSFEWDRGEVDPAIVATVLARYSRPVASFRSGWVEREHSAVTDEWLVFLAGRSVESLTLGFAEFDDRRFHTIHSAMFSCRELTELYLENCRLPAAPSGFLGFPNLTTLSLTMVNLPEHGESTLEAMISLSPLLEWLDLRSVCTDGNQMDEWVIRAPNLMHLTIESDYDYLWRVEELPSLQTATVKVDDDSTDRDLVQLLTCFSQVSMLVLHLPATEDNALDGLSCSFEKLKNLTLHANFRSVSSILCIFSLLTRCPNIGVLDIEIMGSEFPQNDEIDKEFFNTLETNDLFTNLDDITLRNAPCLSNDMHFIEFVLSRARLLSKFWVFRDDSNSLSKPSEEAVIEIAKYRRASPKSRVFFRSMEVSERGERNGTADSGEEMADVQSPPPPPASGQRRRVGPAPDALGSLPLDVLDNILSRLHIHDVVRTSALSRAWRRRWESLPTVDLTRSPGINASDLTLRYTYTKIKLNSCLFSFRELTSLRLHCCGLPHVPTEFAGFPNLKTMYLSVVKVQRHGGRGLATLIAASPVLQEVTLIDVVLIGDGPDEDWVIRASNLRKLTIALGSEYGGRMEDLPRLEECCLFGLNYAKYLTGMARVTKLTFYCNCMLSTEVDVLERLPFLFENLRSLVLGVNFCMMSHISAIFCLLRSAPVLEELDVWHWSEGAQEMEANDVFLNAQWINHMFAKLHVVRMKKVSCLNNEMHFIEFILSKARVLRVLSLTLASDSLSSIEEAIIDITEYPRASPDAQVIFMGVEPESANNDMNGFLYLSAEFPDVEEEETSGLGSLDTVHPRRRQRSNGESVAQLQLLEQLQELEKERDQHHKPTVEELKEIIQEGEKNTIKFQNYFESTIQYLSKQHDLSQFRLPPLPEFPSELSSHPVTTRPGDTPVDPADNVAANVPEDSREGHATSGDADVHTSLPNVLGMVVQNLLQKTKSDESFMILAISVSKRAMAASPPNRKRRLATAETEPESPPDGLGALPVEVLNNILGRLHIYDVVRTSSLSRAWRRRWESLPSVDLTRSPGVAASDVDAVLLRRSATPVRAFRLVARDPSWFVDAFHDWLLHLSRNGVQALELWFPTYNFQLHSCLFSCRELACLDLDRCRLPPARMGFEGFPNLKKLRLHEVTLPEHMGNMLAALISSSPLLEEVELVSVFLVGDYPDDEWVIRAPNLRKLIMVAAFPYGGRVEELPRLEHGILCGPNYAKFLTGMAHVTKLEFMCHYMLSTEVDVLEQLPFLFENLRSLVISVNFCKMSHILFMFCLLRSAPVLEELDVVVMLNDHLQIHYAITCFKGQSNDAQDIDANDEFLNAQPTYDMFAKLRVVQMKKVACLCNEMHFMEFVLNKARVLRVLSVYPSSGVTCSNEQAVITEHPRVSPDAQVIFMNRESANNGYMDTPSVNYKLETTRTGSWIDLAHPCKINRLDLDAVDQHKHIEEMLLIRQKLLKERKEMAQALREDKKLLLNYFAAVKKYFTSNLKYLSEQLNISIPPFPEPSSVSSSSHPTSPRLAEALTDPASRSADNVQADSRADQVAIGASSARANSPKPEDNGSPRRRKLRRPSPGAAPQQPQPSLNSLPSEILENIVGRLPVRQAVRTSALSRDWRRRWVSSPGIRFGWGSGEVGAAAAVGQILARYACPVRHFRHGWIESAGSARADEWLVVLAGRGVEHLALIFSEADNFLFHTLHTAIFSCRELTKLELGSCRLPAAPSDFSGFPNLAVLTLTMVAFPPHGERTLEAMISSAPLLQSLELKNVTMEGGEWDEWVIQAPNLKDLIIQLEFDFLWEIEQLPSIQTATISVDNESTDRDFVQLLTCFAEVDLHIPDTEVDNALEGLSCSFEKLKKLTLHTKFCDVSNILCMFSLLNKCPNIEVLDIEIMESYYPQNDDIDVDFFNTIGTSDMFANLDGITMRNTPCLSNDMHFIEFVLSRARLLSKFWVFRDDSSSFSKPSEEAVIELVKYRRVSPKAKVFFRSMDNLIITELYKDGWQISNLPSLEKAIVDCAIYSDECDFIKLVT
uniref:F-box domain-containing protein n=1 Tax=Oryza meridionalis TaxID=40149 RepID=A0A0E0EM70_9ORYZ